MKSRCGTQRLMLLRKIKSCLGEEFRIYLDSRMVCILIYYNNICYAMNDFHLKKNSHQNRLGQSLTTSWTTSSLVVQLVRQPSCRYELISQPMLAASWQLVANQLAKWNPLPEFTADFTGRVDGPWTRVHFWHPYELGPSSRVSKNALEFTGRVLGPWTRAANSGSGNRALR